MPAGSWTKKDERKYKAIVKSCMRRPLKLRRGSSCKATSKKKACACLAASTVNATTRRRRKR
mgnify:CR=1 FL=1